MFAYFRRLVKLKQIQLLTLTISTLLTY